MRNIFLSIIGFILFEFTNAQNQTLPFAMKLTSLPVTSSDSLPGYFGSDPGVNIDFPVCRVVIDGEFWVIYKNGDGPEVLRYKGKDFETTKKQQSGYTSLPIARPYMLGGMWYDSSEKKLYAPLHCELSGLGGQAVSSTIHRQIHLAVSTDKGLTWQYAGALITRDYPNGTSRAPHEYSGLYWDGGAGDFNIFVDNRGGYIYLFMTQYYWPKLQVEGPGDAYTTVARSAISDRMAPGKWRKFYNGDWSEPGLGGKGSPVNGCLVMYNSYLEKYISIGWDGSLSVCNDLTKQDWSPRFVIQGFTPPAIGTWIAGNDNKIDFTTGGQSLVLYHFKYNKIGLKGRYRLDFLPGKTSASAGYFVGYTDRPVITMEPTKLYLFEPIPESPDPIAARRTRRVGCMSSEVSYSGTWSDEANDSYYETSAKKSTAANSDVQFSFKGSDIYWRPWKGPDCGKADVYLDGVLQNTVDCWAESPGTPYQYGFIKTGLEANSTHRIKIVVRGEKNPRSQGTTIRHMVFEYSAESYRASDGFSSINGKNNWYYLQRNGTEYTNMTFKVPFWTGAGNCAIGYRHQVADACKPVRKWVAPHSGYIRFEGTVSANLPEVTWDPVVTYVDCMKANSIPANSGKAIKASIYKNEMNLLSVSLSNGGSPLSYDIYVQVKTGDSISFSVE